MIVTRDFNMYYGGTYVQTNKGKTVRILAGDEGNNTVVVSSIGDSRSSVDANSLVYSQPPLGYKVVGKSVVYISRVPHRTTRKCVRTDVLNFFYPQQEEFDYMGERLTGFDMYNIFNEEYTSLTLLDTVLKDKYAVPITRFFAVVKKGDKEKPLLYYRQSIVAEYEGNGEFTPIQEGEVFLEKLLREIEDVRY